METLAKFVNSYSINQNSVERTVSEDGVEKVKMTASVSWSYHSRLDVKLTAVIVTGRMGWSPIHIVVIEQQAYRVANI